MLGSGGILSTTCRHHISTCAIQNIGGGTLCWAIADVERAMNCIKYFSCPLLRDYWARFTFGEFTKDGAVVEVDIVKSKASDRGFIGSNFF